MLVNDGRANGELLLSTGTLQDNNLSDCIFFPASLVVADRWEGQLCSKQTGSKAAVGRPQAACGSRRGSSCGAQAMETAVGTCFNTTMNLLSCWPPVTCGVWLLTIRASRVIRSGPPEQSS